MKTMYYLFLVLCAPTFAFAQIQFVDVGPSAGVADAGNGQGVAFFDFNNDGLLDIYLVNNGQSNKLFRNNGGLSFTDVAAQYGVNNSGGGRGVAAGDFNNDGRTDLVIGNFSQNLILYRNDSTTFSTVTTTAGMGYLSWGGSINWFDYNRDGRLDCYIGNDGVPAHYNYLFRNDNLSSFTHVASTMGLLDSVSTLSVATADYDNDGDLDLFEGNQTGSPTGILYRNDGNTFTDVTTASGLVTALYSWGADWGDFDNDGDLDLYLANSNGANQLFRNNGNGTFTEVAAQYGVADAAQSFSCAWVDVDNDGDLDLHVANAATAPDRLYRNDGSTFTDVAASAGTTDNLLSNSTTWGDVNNDGRLDLYMSNNGTANRLYVNRSDSTNHWLVINLRGTVSNRSAIGARVRIRTATGSQIREVQGGSGHNGQNSLPVEFGVGAATVIDSLIIRWPNGIVQRVGQLVANQFLSVVEPPAQSVRPLDGTLPQRFSLEQNYPNPFNPSTMIRFEVGHSGLVSLKVYDVLGKEVATLVNQELDPGRYEVTFSDVQGLSSGIYFYRLSVSPLASRDLVPTNGRDGRAGNFTETRKLVLQK
jgi:hypothetical protein